MSYPSTPFTPTTISSFAAQLPTPSNSMQAEIQHGNIIDFTSQFIDEGGRQVDLIQYFNAASEEGMTTTGPAVADGLDDPLCGGPVMASPVMASPVMASPVMATKFPWKMGGCPQCRHAERGCRGKKKYPCGGPTWKTIQDWNAMGNTEREALFAEFESLSR